MSELTQRRVAGAGQQPQAAAAAATSSTSSSSTGARLLAGGIIANDRTRGYDQYTDTKPLPPVPSFPPPPIPYDTVDTNGNGNDNNAGSARSAPHPILGHTPVPATIASGSVLNNLFRLNAEGEEQPRQLIALAIISIPFFRAALARDSDEPQSSADNMKAAFGAILAVILGYSAIHVRDGVMVRPHPMFWRLVHGCMLVYLLALSALLVQNVSDSRRFLQNWFPDVTDKVDEQWNMQKDCSITWTTLHRQVTSQWFLSHFIGWWGKMIMLRSWGQVWVQSLLFELLEISFQFLIPDFRECWWDSLFIDAFGANLAGMTLGWFTLKLANRYFNTRASYDWATKKQTRAATTFGWLRRLTPFSWPAYRWGAFDSFSRFVTVALISIVPLIIECNCFFMMHVLWIPPGNPMLKIRLLGFFLLSIPAFAEYYEYINNPLSTRIGPNTWLGVTLMIMELLICIKFGRDIFTRGPPTEIWLPWAASAILFTTFLILWFNRPGYKQTSATNHDGTRVITSSPPIPTYSWRDRCLNILFVVSFLPLLALTRLWAG